jgi:hypothetical protein
MKKLLLSLFILTLLCIILLPLGNVKARQGCCSHHGGVCGCRCCDGTSLSATCAPYYPQCNTKSVPATPNYNSPTPKEEPPTSQKYTAEIPKENNGGSIWWWIIGIGVVAYLFYAFRKRK